MFLTPFQEAQPTGRFRCSLGQDMAVPSPPPCWLALLPRISASGTTVRIGHAS